MHTLHSIAVISATRDRITVLGLSIPDAAALIGCAFGTLKNILAGDTEPGPKLIQKCEAWLSIQNKPESNIMPPKGIAGHGIQGSRTPTHYGARNRSVPLNAPTVYTAAQLITRATISTIEGAAIPPDKRLLEYVAHVRTACQVTDDMPTERVRHLVPSIGAIIEHLADMGVARYRTWWRPRPPAKRNEPRRQVADNADDAFA